MAIRAVLFDLDGTLFDRDSPLKPLLESQYDHFANELGHVRRDVFVERVTTLDAHGYGGQPAVYGRIVKEFGIRQSLAPAFVEYFWDHYAKFARPFYVVASTLRELKESGIAVGIITNGLERIQKAVIDTIGIGEYLSAVAISETEGIRKPDPRIFQRTAEKIGVELSRCCYVGDHPVVDVAGSISAGMSAIWKRTSYWQAPKEDVPVIDSIPEILRLWKTI